MGTNYYLYDKPPCECCRHQGEPYHIGKRSAGWCFSLHIDAEEGILNLGDLIARWSLPGAYIEDEYGERISPDQMLKFITERGTDDDTHAWSDGRWRYYHGGEAEFHKHNHSMRGPRGLLRRKIDGRHCVAHGEGPWDYCVGCFS